MVPRTMPDTREERWSLVDALIGHWFGPLEGGTLALSEIEAAERRLGVRFPGALREWYLRWGTRDDVWSCQDRVLAPSNARLVDGLLEFCTENQGLVRWSLPVNEGDDPPVVLTPPGRPRVEARDFSSFAVHLVLMNVKWTALRGIECGNGQATPAAIEAVERSYPRWPTNDLSWPAPPTRHFGDDETLIELQANTWIWVAAKTRASGERIARLFEENGAVWEDATWRDD